MRVYMFLLAWKPPRGSGLVCLICVSLAPNTELGAWQVLSKCVYEQAKEEGEGSGMKVLNTLFLFPGGKKVTVYVLCTSRTCLRV